MGGSACQIIIHANVRFDAVPAGHAQKQELEAQLRECYANPTIAQAVVDEKGDEGAEDLWNILKKAHLSADDLDELLHGLPQYTQ